MRNTDCLKCGSLMPIEYQGSTAYRCPSCDHWNSLKSRGARIPKPPKERRWFSSRYMVSVKYKCFNASDVAHNRGSYFDTFGDAKAHQVNRCANAAAEAEHKLKAAKWALNKASALKEPTP